MPDITIPRKLGKLELKQLKWFKTLPKDVQYEIIFRGLIWIHPNDIKMRLKK